MKRKKKTFSGSKLKAVRNSKAKPSPIRSKNKKLARPSLKKNKPSKRKQKPATSLLHSKRVQLPTSRTDLSEHGKKLDRISAKIDEILAGLDTLSREQTSNAPQLQPGERSTLVSNSDVKQLVIPPSAQFQTTDRSERIERDVSTELSNELTKSEQELDEVKKEENAAKARLSTLNQEFEDIRGKVDALQRYYIAQNQSLEAEVEARRKTIHQRVEDERSKAESEIMLLLRQRDEARDLVRNLSEEKDSLRKDVEFARSLSNLIRNPESIGEVELAVLNQRFDQARTARLKGTRLSSSSNAKAAWQHLLSVIGELSKT